MANKNKKYTDMNTIMEILFEDSDGDGDSNLDIDEFSDTESIIDYEEEELRNVPMETAKVTEVLPTPPSPQNESLVRSDIDDEADSDIISESESDIISESESELSDQSLDIAQPQKRAKTRGGNKRGAHGIRTRGRGRGRVAFGDTPGTSGTGGRQPVRGGRRGVRAHQNCLYLPLLPITARVTSRQMF